MREKKLLRSPELDLSSFKHLLIISQNEKNGKCNLVKEDEARKMGRRLIEKPRRWSAKLTKKNDKILIKTNIVWQSVKLPAVSKLRSFATSPLTAFFIF